MERLEPDESQLSEKWQFLILGLALLYMGRQDASEATMETLKAIPHAQASTNPRRDLIRAFLILLNTQTPILRLVALNPNVNFLASSFLARFFWSHQ